MLPPNVNRICNWNLQLECNWNATAGNCTQEYATGKTQENWRNVYSIFRQFCAELLSQGFGKQSSCHQWGCGAHEVSHHPVRCFDCNYQSIIETDSTLRKHLVRICRAKVHGLCQSCGVAVRAHPHRWCGLVTYFMPMTMHGNVPSKNVQPDHHGYNATSLSEYRMNSTCFVAFCSQTSDKYSSWGTRQNQHLQVIQKAHMTSHCPQLHKDI